MRSSSSTPRRLRLVSTEEAAQTRDDIADDLRAERSRRTGPISSSSIGHARAAARHSRRQGGDASWILIWARPWSSRSVPLRRGGPPLSLGTRHRDDGSAQGRSRMRTGSPRGPRRTSSSPRRRPDPRGPKLQPRGSAAHDCRPGGGLRMGYVAVTGGAAAIEASIERLKYERLRKGRRLSTCERSKRACAPSWTRSCPRPASTMRDGGPFHKAGRGQPGRGRLPHARLPIHPSRARTTLLTVDSARMRVERRISASFKDIPGGQILGASCDYTHRLIDSASSTRPTTRPRAGSSEYLDRDLGPQAFPPSAGRERRGPPPKPRRPGPSTMSGRWGS